MSRDRTTTIAGVVALVWGVIVVVLVLTIIVAGWRYITTDHAVYELETGEYLKCTPQGGNTLTCTIEHRENNQ